MKKKLKLISIILGVSLLVTGCGSKNQESNKEQNQVEAVVEENKVAENTVQDEETITFVGPFDLSVILSTTDNWKTADLMDNSGRIYNLKSAPAASGMLLKNEDGVSIHVKNGEGILILNPGTGNEIVVTEFKDLELEEDIENSIPNGDEEVNANGEVMTFIGPFDLTITLSTTDNWETADLMDNSGRIHKLQSSQTESGILLKNEDGVSIHFENGEGILILNPTTGNEIKVTEFKKQ